MTQMHDVHVSCPICQEISVVTVPLEGLRQWHAGALIQDAMPEVSPDDREKLMTGICTTCWDQSFGDC